MGNYVVSNIPPPTESKLLPTRKDYDAYYEQINNQTSVENQYRKCMLELNKAVLAGGYSVTCKIQMNFIEKNKLVKILKDNGFSVVASDHDDGIYISIHKSN